MKTVATLLLNLITLGTLFSQNCDYEEYYKSVASARIEFSRDNFKEAHKLFKIAFEQTDFPFGADLRDALRITEKIGDKAAMEEIAIRLAKGGIPLKFFKHFDNYKWYKTFCTQFPEYQEYFNGHFDREFRNTLIELEKTDYKTNNHFHEWRTREHEHPIDTLVAEMRDVSTRFQKMVERFGFPSERKTGYHYSKGDVNELPTFVLLVHIYQRGELLYKDQLPQLACKGSLNHNQCSQLQITRGYGDSTGIEQEMEARRKKFRKKG